MKTHSYGNTFRDIAGQRFGRLLAIKVDSIKNKRAYWECLCGCGNRCTIASGDLRSGHTKSCGCINKETPPHTTHGMSRTSEYGIWDNMIARCTRPCSPRYDRYGGRGIKVCERWLSFANFYADMGPRPSPHHQLDRPDNDGNYEPGNCQWLLKSKQQRNTSRSRMIEFDGQTLTLVEWGEKTGIPANLIQQRLSKYHWPVDRALTQPVYPIHRERPNREVSGTP